MKNNFFISEIVMSHFELCLNKGRITVCRSSLYYLMYFFDLAHGQDALDVHTLTFSIEIIKRSSENPAVLHV